MKQLTMLSRRSYGSLDPSDDIHCAKQPGTFPRTGPALLVNNGFMYLSSNIENAEGFINIQGIKGPQFKEACS